MDVDQIQDAVLKKYNLQIGAQTAKYIHDQLTTESGKVEIFGRDARTGVSVTALIEVTALTNLGIQE